MDVQLTHTGAELDAAIGAVLDDYADVSGTTATDADVRAGKTYVKANKVQSTGTLPDSTLTAEAGVSGSVLTDEPGHYGITIQPRAKIDQAGYVGASVNGTEVVKYIKTETVRITANGTYYPSANRLIEEVEVAVPQAKLNKPTLALLDDTLTVYNANNGTFAEYVEVFVSGSSTVLSRVPAQDVTTFYLATMPLAVGYHSISARVTGTGMVNSDDANPVYYQSHAQLDAPVIGIQNTNTLTIGAVTNAHSYEVHADGDEYHVTIETTANTVNLANLLAGKLDHFVITVYALANSYYTKSNASNAVNYATGSNLPTPSLSISGSYLTITDSSSAVEKYDIYDNDIFYQSIKADGSPWTITFSADYDSASGYLQYSTDGGSTWTEISSSGSTIISGFNVMLRLVVSVADYTLRVNISQLGFYAMQRGNGTYISEMLLINDNTTISVVGS